jgi:hypothetical protein
MTSQELRSKIKILQANGKLPKGFAYNFSLKSPVISMNPTEGFLRVTSWGVLMDLPLDVCVLVSAHAFQCLRAEFPSLRTFHDVELQGKLQKGLDLLNARPMLETGPNSPALRALLADRLIGDSFRDGKTSLDGLIEFYTRYVRGEDVLMDWESKVPEVESILQAKDVKRGQKFTHSQAFDDFPDALSVLTIFVRKVDDIVKCGTKFYVAASMTRR